MSNASQDPSLLQLLLTTGDNDEREGIATWARDADQPPDDECGGVQVFGGGYKSRSVKI